MYCPNCGQQQISDEMRFCSRCGLALSGLMEWLAGGAADVKHKETVKVVTRLATAQRNSSRLRN